MNIKTTPQPFLVKRFDVEAPKEAHEDSVWRGISYSTVAPSAIFGRSLLIVSRPRDLYEMKKWDHTKNRSSLIKSITPRSATLLRREASDDKLGTCRRTLLPGRTNTNHAFETSEWDSNPVSKIIDLEISWTA